MFHSESTHGMKYKEEAAPGKLFHKLQKISFKILDLNMVAINQLLCLYVQIQYAVYLAALPMK